MEPLPNDHALRLAELVKSALEQEPGNWKTFLDQKCDPDLRAEVESLLAQQAGATQFLEAPALHYAAETLISDRTCPTEQVIGDYEILSLIARGGMGEVYLASDRQLRRRVALKLIRRGISSQEVIRHFEREQRLLASLNHPNIAQLYGGGVTSDGTPYFAMEYVEGHRLDEHCDSRQLTITERLQLFRKVCAAVTYAHQHLVVHRDIKPGNIRVTVENEPKLLDFGIAKLLEPATALDGEQTLTFAGAMTPEYASPEQVRGESVTTASDVYSLGVVLYKLLTGQSPYRTKTSRPDEIAIAITSQEPERPSTAVKERDSTHSPTTIPDSRLLRGDLDNIVLKAIRKEAARRYESAAELSEDIRRYLEGLPVTARKDTLGYRSAKFVSRHQLGAAAAAIVVLSLIAGVAMTLRQARIASQERDKARLEQAKAERTVQFLQDTLGFADAGWFSPTQGKGPNATIGDALDFAAKRAETELKDQPEVLCRILFTIGTAYRNLGKLDLAETFLRKSFDLGQKIIDPDDPRFADLQSGLGELLIVKGKYAEGEEQIRAALKSYRAHLADGSASLTSLGGALNDLGLLKLATGQPAEGEQLLREAVSLVPRLSAADRVDGASWLTDLGRIRAAQGDLVESESLYRRSIEEYQKQPGPERLELAISLTMLADVLRDKGNYAEAESILRKSLDISKRVAGDNNPNTAMASGALAQVLYLKGDYPGAETAANKALETARAMLPPGHMGFSAPLTTLGLIMTKTGRLADAETTLHEALAIRERVLPKGDWRIAQTESALGECLMTQKRYAEAEPLLLRSYNDLKNSQGAKHPRTIEALERVVKFYEISGNPAEAQKYRVSLPHS